MGRERYAGRGREFVPLPLRKLRAFLEGVPMSAVRDLRGKRPQTVIAAKSGFSQALISDIEKGRKKLTPEVAESLGPALGVDPDELLAAERIGELKRAATEGKIDAHQLLDAILELDAAVPEGRYADELIGELVETFEEVVSTYQEEREQEAALKTDDEPPHRDYLGRRIVKPHDLPATRRKQLEEQDEAPRRDAAGNRLNKPFDPRRG